MLTKAIMWCRRSLTVDTKPKTRKSRYALLAALWILTCVFYSLPASAEILDVQVLWDAADEPLNIGDVIHFKVTTDGPGSVVVDISTVHQSIQLYDNGANGDTIAGDHVYELNYSIFEGDTVEEGPILAHFIAEDGAEEHTGPNDNITPKIDIDGTRPIITNDGVSPSPFNPTKEVTYIRYILTEASSISIKVYDEQNRLIRTLGTPSGKPGENHTEWNGADDEGNVMPDGRYTYEIFATDHSGNDAVSTRGSCILSTVYLLIDDSLVAPNPFSPDGDNVDDITWISFDVKLLATEQQLIALGFGGENLVTATTDDDGDISPFALIGISVFDSSGRSRKVFSSDLTPEADTDFAPNGWPNRKMPPDVPLGSGNYLGLPNGLTDYADEQKGNDWDTLVPLHGPFMSDGQIYYESGFSVGWDAQGTPDGTYLLNIECELVGRTWESAGYMKTDTGFIIGEKWHAVPSRHHGYIAFPRSKSVTIDRREIVSIDDDPPIVTSTNPSSGSAIDPTREKIKDIVANLDDGADGSGVDPIQSSISLLDPLGNKLSGGHVPFGINAIKLALDSEITISGEYSIVIVPVDKRGNKAVEPSVFTFTVEDTSAPTVVQNTVQPKPTEFDDEGTPVDPYIHPIDEISVVLTDGLTGSGVDFGKSVLYLKNSSDETIEGDMKVDTENKKLIYTLKKPLGVSDTYTIVIIAADYAGAKGIYTYQFVVDMANNIVVHRGGKNYLVIYTSTVVLGNKEVDLSGLTVEETDDFPTMVSELNHIDGSSVKFEPYGFELSQEADLTLYYEDSLLPLGISESELSIYAFKAGVKDWVQVPSTVLEKDNRLTARTNYLDQYYLVAYTNPVAPAAEAEISLTPPKYFNPDKELLTFTFARNMTDYKVDVYNVAGDRIVALKETGRSDNSLAWDGRNEDDDSVKNGVFICRISYKADGRSRSLNRLIAVIR